MTFPPPLKLAVALIVPQLAGLIGSFFTTPEIDGWYATLARSSLTPPGWVFGAVWTTLFILMGLAAFLVWHKGLKKRQVRVALGIFIFQLFLNVLWSVFFFGLHDPGAALVQLVSLWTAIVAMMLIFFKISRIAGWLLVPYVAWVSFAAYLNWYIWAFN